MPILDLLVRAGLTQSKGEGRRIIKQNGLKINGKIYNDWKGKIKIAKKGTVIQLGKRKFLKVRLI